MIQRILDVLSLAPTSDKIYRQSQRTRGRSKQRPRKYARAKAKLARSMRERCISIDNGGSKSRLASYN